MTTIKVRSVEGAGLYARYHGQHEQQDCYVELDCRTGDLSCETNPEIGGSIPEDVHYGHRLRWSIMALKAMAANELLEEVKPLTQRVVDGYESVWDGNNHVAELNDDARKAVEEIEVACDQSGYEDTQLVVWRAEDWYLPCESGSDRRERLASVGSDLGVTARTSDAQLRVVARREAEKARDQDVDLIDGLAEYLERVREALRSIAREHATRKAA